MRGGRLRFTTVREALAFAKENKLRVTQHISVKGGMRLQAIATSRTPVEVAEPGTPRTLTVRPPAAPIGAPQPALLERFRDAQVARYPSGAKRVGANRPDSVL